MFEKEIETEKRCIFEEFGISSEKTVKQTVEKMSDILSVGSLPVQDGTIIRKQYHTYSPYTSSFNKNDEVRIAINAQDLFVLPSESYILVEARMTLKSTDPNSQQVGVYPTLTPCTFFSEVRYEINNIEVDRIKNTALTSLLKTYTALPQSSYRSYKQCTYLDGQNITIGTRQFLIPLNLIFGFCDDYKKIIMNAKHELVMLINRNDMHTAFTATITKIQWKMPHIQLSDQAKLQMLKYLERQQSIHVPYRSWETFEMPQLPQSTKHIWTVKSTSQINKPRFVLMAFETHGNSHNCNISDVKLYLNSECYPYDNYNSDFEGGKIQELYHAFLQIQKSYYNSRGGDNPTDYGYTSFLNTPIFTFDCSRNDDSLIGGAVDVRLEINARANIPENTSAFCVIIYDNYFEYSPFSSIVVKKT